MRIVVDASVLVEVLLPTRRGLEVADQLRTAESLHCPDFADVEVLSVTRRLVLAGAVSMDRADQCRVDLRALRARRWPSGPLLERIWQLRDTVTAYDAAYVALAEALDAELLTADARLARGVQVAAHCVVRVVP